VGRQIKCLTVIDEYARRSGRVIEVLARLMSTHGAPLHLRSEPLSAWTTRRSD
jgi:putative transposase